MANPFEFSTGVTGYNPFPQIQAIMDKNKSNQLAQGAFGGDQQSARELAMLNPEMYNTVNTVQGNEQSQAQQMQAQEAQAKSQKLIERAMGGDYAALPELYAMNPKLGEQIDKGLGIQDERQAAQVGGWLEKYLSQTPEKQDEFLRKTASQTPFTVDDDLLEMDPEERKNAAMLMAGRYLNKDQLAMLSGGQTKYQQGTGDMAGYVFNPDSGQYSINPDLKARLDAVNNTPDSLDAKTRQSINKDLTMLTQDTKLIYNTAKDLESLAKIKGGPAAIAMVFKFMKALDPTSVVREGEFMTAENSAGVPEKLRNYYNKISTGDSLGDAQTADFVRTAKELSNSAIENSSTEVNRYLDTFENTLTDSFKSSLKGRIPSKFDIKPVDSMPMPFPPSNPVNWVDL